MTYHSADGTVAGCIGTVWFEDESGARRNFLWDSWGKRFPDFWNRRIADLIVKNARDSEVGGIRRAFETSMQIECEWIIAIGTKSSKAGGELYKTLRTDDTLRVAYGKNLGELNPPEKMFRGDEMRDSLSYILTGQTWGSGTLATFSERNPYRYTIRINSYDVSVYATNCVTCAKNGLRAKGGACPHVEQGTFFCVEVPIERGGSAYSGEKAFAWEGQSVSYTEKTYSGYVRNRAADDASGVRGSLSGNMITPSGDSVLYLAYKYAGGSDPDHPGSSEGGSESEHHDSSETESGDTYPAAGGIIDSRIFSASYAIPSTESLYVDVTAKNYLYDFDASVISGSYPLSVTVEFPYEIRWIEEITVETSEEEDGGKEQEASDETYVEPKPQTERIEHVESGSSYVQVTVYRDYSYTHLNSFAYYALREVKVTNYAMRPATVTMRASDAGAGAPYCAYPTVYGSGEPSLNGNIAYPYDYNGAVTVPLRVIDGGTEAPDIPYFSESEALLAAEASIGAMLCRNDELFFDGSNVMGESGWHEYSGTAHCNTGILGAGTVRLNSDQIFGSRYLSIPSLMRNGTYYSEGRIGYDAEILYNSGGIAYNDSFYVNEIRIHTPVICDLVIGDCDTAHPNSMYVEEIGVDPNDYDMVLSVGRSSDAASSGHENDSCDFILQVSNRGTHGVYAGVLGYSYDYRHNKSGQNGGSYVMLSEVYFPFDVFIDEGVLYDESDDVLISAGQWVNIGYSNARFYLPVWVGEGDYEVRARTYAVNCPDSIRGQDSPYSQAYANNDDSCYVATGTLLLHVSGKMYGLALTDVDSETEWKEVFEGERWGEVRYSAGLNNELGYMVNKDSRYVLPLLDGGHPDPARENTGQLKAGYEWTFNINTTGYKMSQLGSYIHIVPVFHTPRGKRMNLRYRETFVGRGYSDVEVGSATDAMNVKKFGDLGWYTYGEIMVSKPVMATEGMQVWEFKYSLPANVKLSEGSMLVVGFEITAYSDGEPYLSYYCDASECNMWEVEGQQLNRTDYYGREYNFEYGDVLLLDTARTKADDYVTDRTY